MSTMNKKSIEDAVILTTDEAIAFLNRPKTQEELVAEYLNKGGKVIHCPPRSGFKNKWDKRSKGLGVVRGGHRLYLGV